MSEVGNLAIPKKPNSAQRNFQQPVRKGRFVARSVSETSSGVTTPPDRMLSAHLARAVDDNLMAGHLKSVGQKAGQAAQAANKMKEAPAFFADEKMMMMPRCAFVMRLGAGKFDVANLPFVGQLFKAAVHRGNAQGLDLLARLTANLVRRQRLLRGGNDGPDRVALTGFISHGKFSVDSI